MFPRVASVKFRALCLGLGALIGCTASSSEVAPPKYDPYYPTSLVVAPDERYLFVLNANSDLRYDSGTMQVLDLEEIDALVASWNTGTAPAGCYPDELVSQSLVCESSTNGNPAAFVVGGATVKTGNFGTALGVETLVNADGSPSSGLRLFATVRGDPSVTWADFDSETSTLDCGGSGDFPRCTELHRLDEYQNFVGDLPPEPFSLYVDGATERVFITHLTLGYVSLASAPSLIGSEPVLVDVIGGLFAPNYSSGATRAVGVAPRMAGDPDGLVYVTSSSEARIATVYVAAGDELVAGPSFFHGSDVYVGGVPGDARGITFSEDGTRAFVVNRSPPELLVYDTSLGPQGLPFNQLLGGVEICAQPAMVAVTNLGAGTRAFLPCFATGEVWVVDIDDMSLWAIVDVGRGPNGLAIAPTRGRVYVANYAEDTIAVIDAVPGSPTESFAVLKVGKPRGED